MTAEQVPGTRRPGREDIMTDTATTTEPAPCQCHTSFAYISPMHDGHCCFQPATQTCHPAEVAAWEAEAPYRRGEKVRP